MKRHLKKTAHGDGQNRFSIAPFRNTFLVGSFIKQFDVLTNNYCERDGQLLLSQGQA